MLRTMRRLHRRWGDRLFWTVTAITAFVVILLLAWSITRSVGLMVEFAVFVEAVLIAWIALVAALTYSILLVYYRLRWGTWARARRYAADSFASWLTAILSSLP